MKHAEGKFMLEISQKFFSGFEQHQENGNNALECRWFLKRSNVYQVLHRVGWADGKVSILDNVVVYHIKHPEQKKFKTSKRNFFYSSILKAFFSQICFVKSRKAQIYGII